MSFQILSVLHLILLLLVILFLFLTLENKIIDHYIANTLRVITYNSCKILEYNLEFSSHRHIPN